MPSFTFYATAEATVTAGARPVFCDVDPDTRNITAETVKAVADAAHEGDRRGRPVRAAGAAGRAAQSLACRCSRTRPRRPGASLGDRTCRRARRRRDVLVLPLQEPRCLRRRRRDRDRRRRRRGARARPALPRFARQAELRVRRLQLAARRGSGRDPADPAGRARRLVRSPPRGRRRVCAGRHRRVRVPARGTQRRQARVAPVRGDPSRGGRSDRRTQGARHRDARLLPHAAASPSRDVAVRDGRAAPRHRRAQPRQPRAADEPGADLGAGRRGRGGASRHWPVEGLGRPHQLASRAGDAAR